MAFHNLDPLCDGPNSCLFILELQSSIRKLGAGILPAPLCLFGLVGASLWSLMKRQGKARKEVRGPSVFEMTPGGE